MSGNDEWSPDEPSGTEVFEPGDEALDDTSGRRTDSVEDVEQDPTLDPTLLADERERQEAGTKLDDPETLAVLDGGIDDPDGTGAPAGAGRSRNEDEAGWDLDAPLARDDDDSDDDLIG
ncbi:MAG TPA: hypothetical protein VIJ09_01130 [Acidimicrobiales bacterium]